MIACFKVVHELRRRAHRSVPLSYELYHHWPRFIIILSMSLMSSVSVYMAPWLTKSEFTINRELASYWFVSFACTWFKQDEFTINR